MTATMHKKLHLRGRGRWAGLLLLFFLLNLAGLAAQQADSAYVYIDHIALEGNHKTRPAWILRELEFAEGDSLLMADLSKSLERNSLRLMNTGLFSSAKINVKTWGAGNHIDLHIQLVESWYIYPIPVFSLADRNFNVWWKEYEHSLKRINYGLNLYHFNLTGRNDVAVVSAQWGYTRKYEFSYKRPGIDRKKNWGFETGMLWSKAREVAYTSRDNKLVFNFNPDQVQIQRFRAELGLTWRPFLREKHTLTVEFHRLHVSDSVATVLNPDFFLHGRTRQQHPSLVYSYESDWRDIKPYPLHGWYFFGEFRRNGFFPSDDLHLSRLLLEYRHYRSFSKKWSVEGIAVGRVSFPRKKPPYFNDTALGFNADFIRGYEYYVQDGLDFGYLKTALHWEIFNRVFDASTLVPLAPFKIFPLKMYLSMNNDLGFSNDPHYGALNPLSNTLLHGYGIGLDIVAYYDKIARFEYSINQRGQGGLYLHIQSAF